MAEGNLKYSGQLLKIMGLIGVKNHVNYGDNTLRFPEKKKKLKCLVLHCVYFYYLSCDL